MAAHAWILCLPQGVHVGCRAFVRAPPPLLPLMCRSIGAVPPALVLYSHSSLGVAPPLAGSEGHGGHPCVMLRHYCGLRARWVAVGLLPLCDFTCGLCHPLSPSCIAACLPPLCVAMAVCTLGGKSYLCVCSPYIFVCCPCMGTAYCLAPWSC